MTKWHLYSEPFARTGNIAAEGFRKLLGRPALGLLQTVIREAMQNSIDASTTGRGPEVLLRSRLLSSPEARWLLEDLFRELPEEGDASCELHGLLMGGKIRVFEICDFGTTGLGGPTRADFPVEPTEDPDFVNFLRNVGAPRDTHQGGGTYGYGKTSLYSLSACATIIIDTQTRYQGEAVRRMMACQLGSAYDADSPVGRRRFTGRHWWGTGDGDGGVDPLSGHDATAAASSLGLPKRNPDHPGTSILILAPRVEEESDAVPSGADLVETVLWNFWPRMCACMEPSRRLKVRISVDGEDIPCPAPEQFPPLDLFAEAFNDCRKRKGVDEIRSKRPKKLLGHLAIRRGMRADRHHVALRAESAIPRQASHIALMRPVELVVRYMPGEPFPDRRFEWGGVFICSDEDDVERAFADSEPPAHDDWIPNMLPSGREKTFVNVALKLLAENAKTYVAPRPGDAAAGERGPSLARTAAAMGQILDASSARGPGRQRGSGGSDSKSKTLSISPARFVRLALADEGRKLAVFNADLMNDAQDELLRVKAEPYLVMDGGAATAEDLPVDFTGGIESLRFGEKTTQEHVLLVGTVSGVIECMVPVPEEAAVGLRLQLVSGARS